MPSRTGDHDGTEDDDQHETCQPRWREGVAYGAIEEIAGRHMHRRDYLEDEATEQLVKAVTPYDPG